ncbi:CopG family ribbon-helix-helix protein [Paludibacterium purpuratum]|uniref:Putative transcriptional regulator n=1 Tax=Paludibacterium purpuratum TaxID=1144873 RepID=A0A4R7B628_9NEIS|nr:CopG family transcriptional regulator [Paludibacterium purpuratum]TDR80091.1 putative transcriptional regulator [Paludibacterium purpuratum]
MSVMSVRLTDEATQQLEALAVATGRKKSFLISQAIGDYLAREAWQIQEIQAAITEADAGEFAEDAEVNAFFERWGA